MDIRAREEARQKSIEVFCCYARADEHLRNQLKNHLQFLQRQGLIELWYDCEIRAGSEWELEIKEQLDTAQIILLLVSPDFMASDYCYSVEMTRAMGRHNANKARVIPILLRPVDWSKAPFAHLQVLPTNARPITLWSNRDEAFVDVARGIHRAAIENLTPFSANNVCNDKLVKMAEDAGKYQIDNDKTVQGLVIGDNATVHQHFITATQPDLNRLYFLTRLSTRYLDLLKRSLQGRALLAPRLHEKPEAVAHSAHLVFRHLNQSEQALPPGISIAEVYEHADGELLILGEPGTGKSTLLVQLAQILLKRAERDEWQAFPVLLNLSSWTVKRWAIINRPLLLQDWIAEQLAEIYGVPRKLAAQWVQENAIIPLLDGLDTLKQQDLSACVREINRYRNSRLTPIVVCSRTEEYTQQNERLILRKAIEVQELTTEEDKNVGLLKLEEISPRLVHDSTTLQQFSLPSSIVKTDALSLSHGDYFLQNREPIKLFYCYAPKDRKLRDKLETHLMVLKRLRQITLRLNYEIVPGTDWKYSQEERFHMADLILLLISPDFIASDYHYSVEMYNALEKHKAGNVWVLPILLRPTPLWQQTPLGTLQILPKNGKAITEHSRHDAVLADIVKRISEVVSLLLVQKYPFPNKENYRQHTKVTQAIGPHCASCGARNTSKSHVCENCGDLLL